MLLTLGHIFGVRVDGASPRGLWPPVGGGLCSLALRGQGERFLGLTGLMAGGFLSLTALWAEGCGLPLCGNAYKVSVTGLAFCVIWHDKHSADWLAALAPLSGCAGLPPKGETTHYDLCVAGAPSNHVRCASTGKRVTRFSGRFAPLRIVFPCHPCSGGRIKHRETLSS